LLAPQSVRSFQTAIFGSCAADATQLAVIPSRAMGNLGNCAMMD
jgi:hypothetical protein